jgi:hypothetical protein
MIMGIGETASGEMERGALHAVKVFSATMARDRESLGERVTAWIRGNPDVPVLSTVVTQSSDSGFHCISIVVFCGRPTNR